MDFEQEDSTRERLFVLRLMDFVYGLAGRPLQSCLQDMLDEYPKSRESYFSENITQAILIYIKDFRSSDIDLVDLASPAYQKKMVELSKFYDSFDFLKFLAHYSWKSADEYYSNKLFDSPAKFFSSIVRFLEEMRKAGRCDENFWKRLEAASTRIIAKDLEVIKSENRRFRDVIVDESMTAEREFILEVMRIISRAYRNPLPDYLSNAFEEFMLTSTFEYDQNLENALDIAMENLERNVTNLGSDESICDYFYELVKNNFNARDFLEYCVCSTRKALFEYYGDLKDDSPQKAYDRLMFLLESAKKTGKFHSVEDLIDGAHEIIEKEKDRKAAFELRFNNTSTNVYSDISSESNEPNSDWENLITPCDHIRPDKDSKSKKSPGKNTKLKKIASKPDTKNVTSPSKKLRSPKGASKVKTKVGIEEATTSDQKPQLVKGTLKTSEKDAQSAIEKATKENTQLALKQPDKNSQLSLTLKIPENNAISAIEKVISEEKAQLTDNLNISEDNAHTFRVEIVVSKEDTEPAFEVAIVPGKNTQSTPKKGINFGENVQLAFDSLTISDDKAQSSSDKAITSSDSTKQASDSQNLMNPCEHKKDSCKCCKCCCTTT